MRQQRIFRRRGRHDITTSLLVDHSTVPRETRLTGAVYSGPGRAYKAVVHLDGLRVRACRVAVRIAISCQLQMTQHVASQE